MPLFFSRTKPPTLSAALQMFKQNRDTTTPNHTHRHIGFGPPVNTQMHLSQPGFLQFREVTLLPKSLICMTYGLILLRSSGHSPASPLFCVSRGGPSSNSLLRSLVHWPSPLFLISPLDWATYYLSVSLPSLWKQVQETHMS